MNKQTITKDTYLKKLNELSAKFEATPNTPMGMYCKVVNLIVLNMRYEKVEFDNTITRHPYLITADLISEQIQTFEQFKEILFIEGNKKGATRSFEDIEEKHHDLWNEIWNKYDEASYEEKVNRYKHRIAINQLAPFIKGKQCADFGCGHGTFSVAMAESGAAHVTGVDYSEDSLAFGKQMLEKRPSKAIINYKHASVYELPLADNSIDVAVQNGVYHHLNEEPKAIDEIVRVLKQGGYLWYYVDGEGGIRYDLWDESVRLLREVPIQFIQQVLRQMNVSTNKTYHLSDGLKATYHHTSWDKLTKLLSEKGFGEFKRMQGGFPTDMDGDVVANDPYAKEKFGDGDIRVWAKLLRK